MASQDTVIRFRDTDEAQAALALAAHQRGVSASDLIRRAIRKEVPELAALELGAVDRAPAEVLARVLAGEEGASPELLNMVRDGSDEDRAELLRLLVGYAIWELRPFSLSAADLHEVASCTDMRMVPVGRLEPETLP